MDSFDIDSEGPTNSQALNHWPLAEGVNRNIASSDKDQRFVSLSLDFNLLLISDYAECITKLLIQFWALVLVLVHVFHTEAQHQTLFLKNIFVMPLLILKIKLKITTNRGSTLGIVAKSHYCSKNNGIFNLCLVSL